MNTEEVMDEQVDSADDSTTTTVNTIEDTKQTSREKEKEPTDIYSALAKFLTKQGVSKEHADAFVKAFKEEYAPQFFTTPSNRPSNDYALTPTDPTLEQFKQELELMRNLREIINTYGRDSFEAQLLTRMMRDRYLRSMYPYPQYPHNGNGHAREDKFTRLIDGMFETYQYAVLMSRLSKIFPLNDGDNNNNNNKLIEMLITKLDENNKTMMNLITQLREDETKKAMDEIKQALQQSFQQLSDSISSVAHSSESANGNRDVIIHSLEYVNNLINTLEQYGIIKRRGNDEKEEDITAKLTESIQKSRELLEATGRYHIEEVPLTKEKIKEMVMEEAERRLKDLDIDTLKPIIEAKGYTLQRKTLTKEEVDKLLEEQRKAVATEVEKKVKDNMRWEFLNNMASKLADYIGPVVMQTGSTLLGESIKKMLNSPIPQPQPQPQPQSQQQPQQQQQQQIQTQNTVTLQQQIQPQQQSQKQSQKAVTLQKQTQPTKSVKSTNTKTEMNNSSKKTKEINAEIPVKVE